MLRFLYPTALILLLAISGLTQDTNEPAREIMKSFTNSDYQKTIEHCNKAIRKYPTPKEAPLDFPGLFYAPYFFKGVSHFYMNEFDSAFAVLQISQKRELGNILSQGFIKQRESILESLKNRRELQEAKRQTAKQDQQLSSIISDIANGHLDRAKATLEALQKASPDNPIAGRISQWIELEKTKPTTARPISNDTLDVSQQLVRAKFESGLGYYLRGDFSRARENFDEVLREQPNYTLAAGLISKIKTESVAQQKNSTPLVSPDTVRITSTSDPSLAISPFDSVTKQETLVLKGRASDDVGIDFIQFIINGTISTIYPKQSEEKGKLEFSQHIPLNVGRNGIRVNVYDKEKPPRSFFEEYTIVRYVPWYKGSTFLVPLSLIMLSTVAVFLFLWIKKVTIKIEDIPNPYVFGPPIENKDKFYGREKFLQKIEEALHRSSVVIQGERRIGKTSLLRQLKHRLKRPGYPISLSMEQIMSESTFLRDLALGILRGSSEYLFDMNEEQEKRIKQKDSAYGSHDLFDDLVWVIEKFKELDPQAMLVIMIDEIDQTNNWDPNLQQNLRGIFLQDTADVRLVLAGVRIVDRVLDDKTSPWYNPCRHFVLEPLTEDECRELITAPAKGFHYHEEALKHIMSMTQCKPHFVQMTCSFAFEIAQRQRTKDITYPMAQKAFDQAVQEYSTVMEAVWAKLPVELRRTFELANPINSFKYTLEINRLAELSLCSRNPLNRKVAPSPIFERWIERSKNE